MTIPYPLFWLYAMGSPLKNWTKNTRCVIGEAIFRLDASMWWSEDTDWLLMGNFKFYLKFKNLSGLEYEKKSREFSVLAPIVEINRSPNGWRLSCAKTFRMWNRIYFSFEKLENASQQFSVWSVMKFGQYQCLPSRQRFTCGACGREWPTQSSHEAFTHFNRTHDWNCFRCPKIFHSSTRDTKNRWIQFVGAFYGQTKISAMNASVFFFFFFFVILLLFGSTKLVRDKHERSCCFCFGIVSLS